MRRLGWILGFAFALAAAAPAAAETVTFRFVPQPDQEVQSVSVRGTFNDWGETPMVRGDDGVWSVTLDLPEGEHQYKYFVDGQWPQNMETDHGGAALDPEAEGYADDGFGGQNAVRVIGAGGPPSPTGPPESEAPPLAEERARIHYHRPHGQYAGWGLHLWEDTEESVTWESPMPPAGRDGYGLWWDVRLAPGAERVGFIVHRGEQKDPGPDQFLEIDSHGREIWLVSGRNEIFTEAPDVAALALGDLTSARAHWVAPEWLAWNVRAAEGATVRLHAAENADLALTAEGVRGGENRTLEPVSRGLPPELRQRFPHLRGYRAFRLEDADRAWIQRALRGQLALSLTDAQGKLRDATGVQIPGVVDALYATDAPLGIVWVDGAPSLHVWAPTARSVRLHLFETSGAAEADEAIEMTRAANGVWSAQGAPAWKDRFYLYEVEVYAPATGRVERNLVTDPYSRSLGVNSRKSQIVDLDDEDLLPPGWARLRKPPLEAPEDIAIYELHVRDFSASAPQGALPRELRGKYLAFARDWEGTRHLRSLAEAGLTHVHLLPAFDIATVNEDASEHAGIGTPSLDDPASELPQTRVASVRATDAYNWGYDPWHYGVPEGSYATDPDGSRRIYEFRRMVQGLATLGLRTVMDVVYNHTHASGQDERSVLDRIVPGYYHRLNADGAVETSTCCQNTASEHAMMERLIVDDVVHWARDYKIDGFRFDLMGHHMKRNLERVRDALRALTPEADGVDGSAIYVYGEGWDFGEVAEGARGVNATQRNLAGTGIGTFNDRLRDAVRGGNPFGDRREQGFATGLAVDPSGFTQAPLAQQRGELARLQDRIRIGLAGNLKSYRLDSHTGQTLPGGHPGLGGYTEDPQECVNYVSAHDNETLWDKIAWAAPADATLEERVAMQTLALAVVALGQGVPFFHAGSEMLRSKSLDADSYDSGDWFNRLDYTFASNNFGVGLPPPEKNRERWDLMRPILRNPANQPDSATIAGVVERFRALLRVRKSSPLFRLRSAEEIEARLRFHNLGPEQHPGLIVMSVSDEVSGRDDLDPEREEVVVLLHAGDGESVFDSPEWKGVELRPHPALGEARARFERGSGRFRLTGRGAWVFVRPES